MNPRPTEIKLDGPQHLLIAWSDGQRRRYAFHEIQKWCPCASCREKRAGAAEKSSASRDILPIIRSEETQPLKLVSVDPVGSYAYNIYFNQGCRNGIYTLEHLRELGEVVAGA